MPERSVEQEERLALLREELAALPAETAQVITLHHLSGLSTSEVSTQTGLSVDACKQRLVRGREALRERLERRGVVLSVVAFGELLDGWSAAATQFADGLDANTVTRMANTALDASGTTGAENTETEGASISGMDGAAGKASRLDTAGRTQSMSRSHLFAAASVLILLAAASFGVMLAPEKDQNAPDKSHDVISQNEPRSPKDPKSGQKVAKPATSPASDRSTQASTRSTPVVAEPRWQPPRFIDDGGYYPISISASGATVSLLCRDMETPADKPRLVVLESKDAGMTWKKGTLLEGCGTGAVALAGNGTETVLGLPVMKPDPGTPQQRARRQGPLDLPYAKAQLFSRGTGSDYTPRKAVEAGGSKMLFWRPKLARTANSAWFFLYGGNAQGGLMELAVGRQTANQATSMLPAKWNGRGHFQPTGWAADENTAGFVLAAPNAKSLKHWVTTDGGAAWRETDVPFNMDAGSNQSYISVVPMALARNQKRLVLLIGALLPPGKRGMPVPGLQKFALLSEDLGETWGAPMIVGARSDLMTESAGFYDAHATEDRTFICNTKAKFDPRFIQSLMAGTPSPDGSVKLPFSSIKVEVRVLERGGTAWINHHAFDAFGESCGLVVIGGDKRSVHVALLRFGERKPDGTVDDATLVIRSFAPGKWEQAKNTPGWFKEKELPEPTTIDF